MGKTSESTLVNLKRHIVPLQVFTLEKIIIDITAVVEEEISEDIMTEEMITDVIIVHDLLQDMKGTIITTEDQDHLHHQEDTMIVVGDIDHDQDHLHHQEDTMIVVEDIVETVLHQEGTHIIQDHHQDDIRLFLF